jgi:hypothetical protein
MRFRCTGRKTVSVSDNSWVCGDRRLLASRVKIGAHGHGTHGFGVVVLAVLTGMVVASIYGAAHAAQPGFEKTCAGFAADPVLSALWSGTAEDQTEAASSLPEVPRLSLRGTALATRDLQPEAGGQPSLESIFGVSSHEPREVVEASFHQESSAVVLSPHLLATVAHALTPDRVDVHVTSRDSVTTVPLRISQMSITIYGDRGANGILADIAHKNERYDLALVQTPRHAALVPLRYPTALSYGTGNPAHPTGGLRAGDCVAAIVPVRNAQHQDTGVRRLAVGKVLAKAPVAVNSMTQTKLNVNMFTTDVDVQPGDSGSPVLALQADQPVLVGLVAATMYPVATFTYVTRIDPLLAFANALRQPSGKP